MRFLTDLAHSADMIGFSDLGLPKEAVAITSVPDIHQSICWLVLCLVISRAKSVSETFYSCFPQSLLWVLSGCWFRLTECSVLTTLLAGAEWPANSPPFLLQRSWAFGGS